MPRCLSATFCLPLIGTLRRRAPSPESQLSSSNSRRSNSDKQHTAYIHILDDDSLLTIFHFCRPVLSDEDEVDDNPSLLGGPWDHESWWYKLVRICRSWRFLILGSASYLGIHLLCTYGTPIADMLSGSSRIPLLIDCSDRYHSITAIEEEAIVHALQHTDRVRRIRLFMPSSNLRELLLAMDEEFQLLEYLFIVPKTLDGKSLTLPKSFRAPALRHLMLINFALPLGSPSFVTPRNLVTLKLQDIPSSTSFRPDEFSRWLSFMPQLETLVIDFSFHLPSHDLESQLLHNPVTSHVTLPNLRRFRFYGVSPYLEALLPSMTAPRLEKLQILLFNDLTFSIARLAHFINTNEDLRFSSALLGFYNKGVTVTISREGSRRHTHFWCIDVSCTHFDRQLSCAARITDAVRPSLSAVVDVILEYRRASMSSGGNDEANRTQWRKLFRSFGNVKTLHVPNGLLGELSRSLLAEDGESPMGVLPELRKLSYSGSGNAGDEFTPFLDARRNAGRPVTLVPQEKPYFWKWS